MLTLGASQFIHNALDFDYCVVPSLDSLCALCDEVVITDCSSTDGTLDLLRECAARHANLRVIEGLPWEIGEKSGRLADQANIARGYIKTDWHFMLQADEVIHERSFPAIREAVADERYRSYLCRRYNLYGDLNHYVRFDLQNSFKPCSDQVVRLARTEYPAYGDAESLAVDPMTLCPRRCDEIVIYHYGLVRRDANHLNKIIDMQSWFFSNTEGQLHVDKRVLDMKATSGRFEWERMYQRQHFAELPYPHPVFAKEWAQERQAEKVPV